MPLVYDGIVAQGSAIPCDSPTAFLTSAVPASTGAQAVWLSCQLMWEGSAGFSTVNAVINGDPGSCYPPDAALYEFGALGGSEEIDFGAGYFFTFPAPGAIFVPEWIPTTKTITFKNLNFPGNGVVYYVIRQFRGTLTEETFVGSGIPDKFAAVEAHGDSNIPPGSITLAVTNATKVLVQAYADRAGGGVPDLTDVGYDVVRWSGSHGGTHGPFAWERWASVDDCAASSYTASASATVDIFGGAAMEALSVQAGGSLACNVPSDAGIFASPGGHAAGGSGGTLGPNDAGISTSHRRTAPLRGT